MGFNYACCHEIERMPMPRKRCTSTAATPLSGTIEKRLSNRYALEGYNVTIEIS